MNGRLRREMRRDEPWIDTSATTGPGCLMGGSLRADDHLTRRIEREETDKLNGGRRMAAWRRRVRTPYTPDAPEKDVEALTEWTDG
jgi:hypothetical protein